MEGILFVLWWIGMASVHTLIELKLTGGSGAEEGRAEKAAIVCQRKKKGGNSVAE